MVQDGEIPVYGKLIAETTDGKICNASQVDGIENYASSATVTAEAAARQAADDDIMDLLYACM